MELPRQHRAAVMHTNTQPNWVAQTQARDRSAHHFIKSEGGLQQVLQLCVEQTEGAAQLTTKQARRHTHSSTRAHGLTSRRAPCSCRNMRKGWWWPRAVSQGLPQRFPGTRTRVFAAPAAVCPRWETGPGTTAARERLHPPRPHGRSHTGVRRGAREEVRTVRVRVSVVHGVGAGKAGVGGHGGRWAG
jgi:hypothetical protein